jgi:hypothetical protein
VIILTGASAGCIAAAEEVPAPDEPVQPVAVAESPAASALPLVGTWRWSGSGGRIGNIELGEEHFAFRDDGTYAVLSKAGDGWSECYEGTFTWTAGAEPGHGTIVFKSSHLRNPEGFERDVYLEGADTLSFGEAGTYRRTSVVDVRCP